MSATEIDELGPVDYLVVEFPAGKSNFSVRWPPSSHRSSSRGRSVCLT